MKHGPHFAVCELAHSARHVGAAFFLDDSLGKRSASGTKGQEAVTRADDTAIVVLGAAVRADGVPATGQSSRSRS